jgi:catechol 2,3-dioxygenase-like lactoylglutathione lyase family enzyme
VSAAPGAGPITGLDHVQVSCPAGSEDLLRAFYVGVLGFAELIKPPALAARGGAWFRSGGCELHCGVEPDFRPAEKAHPGISVRDSAGLDELAAACIEAGHPVIWSDDIPGVRRFHVADPVGNRLELLTRP